MSADVDNRLRVLQHYTAEIAKLDAPPVRFTIEAFALDPDVDLTQVTFEFAPHRDFGAARACRFVVATDARGRQRPVGLWRVVPSDG